MLWSLFTFHDSSFLRIYVRQASYDLTAKFEKSRGRMKNQHVSKQTDYLI